MYTVNLAALRTVTTARITMHILILYVYIVASCFTILCKCTPYKTSDIRHLMFIYRSDECDAVV